jgi:hypothetical protein
MKAFVTAGAVVLAGCLPQPDPPPPPPAYGAQALPTYAPSYGTGQPPSYYPPAPYAAPPPAAVAAPPPQTQPPPPLLQPAPSPGDAFAAARQRCLEETNAYRARVGAPPLTMRADKLACTDVDARGDATHGTVHGASGRCGLDAQNECPRWDAPAANMVTACLASMFGEGPGEPYQAHGHYINMTNAAYHGLACGFHETADGHVWLVQNYFR